MSGTSEVQDPSGKEGLASSVCHLRKISLCPVAAVRALSLSELCSYVSQESSELPSERGSFGLLRGSFLGACVCLEISFTRITRNNSWFGCVVMFFPKHRQNENGKADNFSVLDFCPGFKLWSDVLLVRQRRPPSSRTKCLLTPLYLKETALQSFACLSFTHSPYFLFQPPPATPGTLLFTSGIRNLMKFDRSVGLIDRISMDSGLKSMASGIDLV